ncbi:MAG TPA: hypothetical protein VMI54_07050 [Polyangiaceae bacterium]|nr:hypothetical protein [Polyangiaceae bacterium]
MNCSSGDDDSGSKGSGGTSAGATGGAGGAGGSSTAGTPGSGGTGGTGGSSGGTGGSTGGTGGSTGGSTAMAGKGGSAGASGTGGSGTGGMAGKGTAGGGSGGKGTAGGGGMGGSSGSGMGGMGGAHGGASGSGGATGAGGTGSGTFTITSPDQMDGAQFGMMFTCAANGGNLGGGENPELDWSGAPSGTLSFAMTFIDTKLGAEMATGEHWAAWNIPPAAMQMPRGTTMLTGDLMGALQTNKFLAPCPSGNDTYELTIYALATATLNVPSSTAGSGTSNSPGVKTVYDTLHDSTKSMVLGTAVLHGKSGAKGGMYMGS